MTEMTTTEIILLAALAVSCIIGGVLLHRLEKVTALNIDLRNKNAKLREQLNDIHGLVKNEFDMMFDKFNNKKSESSHE